jgi:hypothetical protein
LALLVRGTQDIPTSIPTCFDREQFDFSEKLKHFVCCARSRSLGLPEKKRAERTELQHNKVQHGVQRGEGKSENENKNFCRAFWNVEVFFFLLFRVLAFNGTRCLVSRRSFSRTQRTGRTFPPRNLCLFGN